MSDIIFETINLAIMIIAAVVAKHLVPWLKEKIGTEKLNTIAQWAEKAVLYAEQIMTAATGEEKKDAVTAILKEIVETNHISITDEQIEILIESAVKQMNMDSMVIEVESDVEVEADSEEETEPEEEASEDVTEETPAEEEIEAEPEEPAEAETEEKVETESETTAVVGETAAE